MIIWIPLKEDGQPLRRGGNQGRTIRAYERKTDAIRFGNRLGATQMVRIDTEEMREANLFYGLRS